jgi:hypothetical protein
VVVQAVELVLITNLEQAHLVKAIMVVKVKMVQLITAQVVAVAQVELVAM